MKKLILVVILLGVMVYCYNWQSPTINYDTKYSPEECINLDLDIKQKVAIGSFNIDYIENSRPSCINPYFPSIKIHSKIVHNAWLQVVYTDQQQWKVFIDSADKEKYPLVYPFYTMEDNFYDAPLWIYNLQSKIRWEGHVYPVKVVGNQIIFVDGVAWGFEILPLKLRPKMIIPRLITEKEFAVDFEFLKSELKQYKLTQNKTID